MYRTLAATNLSFSRGALRMVPALFLLACEPGGGWDTQRPVDRALDTVHSGLSIAAPPVVSEAHKLSASDGAADDYFAYDVSGGGDVNGDGYDDVIVGAYLDDDGGSDAGAAYVYLGSAGGVDLSTEGKIVASDAAAGDKFGVGVQLAGDVNGDGFDDVIVGSMYDDDAGTDSGSAYVYHGSPSGIDLGSETKLIASDGDIDDYFGWVVAGAGDVNGDGYDDVIVGAQRDDDLGDRSGAAYVFFGSVHGIDGGTELKLTASDGVEGNLFGAVVAGAGDVNDDGYDDVIVGAYGATSASAGAAYLYLGSASGDLATEQRLTASDGHIGDAFGRAAAGAGDVNGDGYDDVVVGAYADDDAEAYAGAAYVFLGGPTGIDLAEETKLTAVAPEASDRFGYDVSGAEDVDGDGYDDVVIGAYLDDELGSASGSVFLFLGGPQGVDPTGATMLNASDGEAEDYFGLSVAAAGDVDGDGYADLIVAADGDDDVATNAGAAYVFAGECRDEDEDGLCDEVDPCVTSDLADVDGDGLEDVCDLSVKKLSAVCPGENSFRIDNVTPYGQFQLWAGEPGGPAVLPSGSCAGIDVSLGTVAKELATLTANEMGTKIVHPTLPDVACGKALVVVDLTSCNASPALDL